MIGLGADAPSSATDGELRHSPASEAVVEAHRAAARSNRAGTARPRTGWPSSSRRRSTPVPRCPGRCRRSAVARSETSGRCGGVWRRSSARPTSRRSRTTEPESGERLDGTSRTAPSTHRHAATARAAVTWRTPVIRVAVRQDRKARSTSIDGHAGVIEAVEVVQSGSGAMRCHGHCRWQPERDDASAAGATSTLPRSSTSTPGDGSVSHPARSAVATRRRLKFSDGSLLAGERSMLSGSRARRRR